MTVEVATYITDLQAANPPSSDPRAQGDDHIRLLKAVLQSTFPNASRAVYAAGTLSKSTNYSVAKADGESTLYTSTASGVVTLTLPSLAAGDAGWRVYFVKTSTDVNPVFVAPAAGTLTSGYIPGLVKARRCIPGVRNTAIWDGANWFVTRSLAVPVGAYLDFHGSVLPAGFEFPTGQTLTPANYPEYASQVSGTGATPDTRGCTLAALDNLGGSAAGRLGSVIAGNTLGTLGGAEYVVLTLAQLPSHSHANTLSDPGHYHTVNGASQMGTGFSGGGFGPPAVTTSVNTDSKATGISINNAAAGSGSLHSNVQPTVICGRLLVVE